MREIKFRAWWIDEGIMINDYASNPFSYLRVSKWDDAVPEVKLMQYTGLKDKNGTEIYEGDVVSVDHHPFELNGKYEVGYNDVMELCAGSLILHRIKNYCEVIGNVFEDGELLEGNN